MAAKGTKKAPAKSVKSAAKGKAVKKSAKLPGFFSFKNQKFVLLVAIVVGFAGGGSYWMYESSSARVAKDLNTVQGCEGTAAVLRAGPNNTVGSTGSCVKAVQLVLNAARTFHIRHENNPPWGYIYPDGKYGPVTALSVAAYQGFMNSYAAVNPKLATDGVVGSQTWFRMRQLTCSEIISVACGD